MKKLAILSLLLVMHSICIGQWRLDSLSDARMSPATAVIGDRAFFVGGQKGGFYPIASGAVDEFDMSTGVKTARNFTARIDPAVAAVGSKLLVASGALTLSTYYGYVDIFDTVSNSWSQVLLKGPRSIGAAASVGTKALFAGGRDLNGYYTRVDIYNAATNVWSAANLSKAREKITAVNVDNSVVFAGGIGLQAGVQNYVRNVDVYNSMNNTWSAYTMTYARRLFTGASVGHVVLLAGGLTNKNISARTVDIYNDSSHIWSTALLSQPHFSSCSAVVGNKVYFAGGYKDSNLVATARVDIYDALLNTWSTLNLPVPVANLSSLVDGQYIYFAGGITTAGVPTDSVFVLNTTTRSWSIMRLNVARTYCGAVRTSHHFLVGGGAVTTTGGYTKLVDILDLSTLRLRLENPEVSFSQGIYPNPCSNTFQLSGIEGVVNVELFSVDGKLVAVHLNVDANTPLDVSDLKSGMYLVSITDAATQDEGRKSFVRLMKN